MRSQSKWLLMAALPVIAASLIGNAATMPAIPVWYAGLIKPWFNPPNWIFGPVWTTLYALMIWAFWQVLRAPADHPHRKIAIIIFLAQIATNALWSIVFFGLHQIGIAVLVSTALLLLVIATVIFFYRVDRLAAWAVAPTIAWVSFATFLNATIWRLN
jgi:benzodiazapine receptor